MHGETLSKEAVLDRYQQSDKIKLFDAMTHDMDEHRLRAHNQETIEGRWLIKYIALIL